MKKVLILSVFAAMAFVGCKKKEATISTLHSYSKPTIIITSGEYYSIPVGGLLPEITATAYDSFYHESCTVVYDQSKLDNTTPGAYKITATAKNQYGMAATRTLYVAVTSADPAVNLAGMYVQTATDDTVMLTALANGFYMTNDVAGNGASDTTYVIPAYFVQTSDVALSMPAQDSKFGTIYGTGGTITMGPTDTTYEYVLHNNFFAPTIRVFKKI
jgi:hypothetical protein